MSRARGVGAQAWLEHLVLKGAAWFPDGLPPAYESVLARELALIADKNYAFYFLTVHDIVAHARSLNPPILCQGRAARPIRWSVISGHHPD
jgi:error-prone DNA polymerase